ncbi:MAG: hypothetical protein GXY47_15235 [Acidobacteria bacterium]|nr:hypothetical protein [Acidobacteriota bacterium]
MSRKTGSFLLAAVLCLSGFVCLSDEVAADEELKPEQLVAAHVKSIGSPDYLARVRSRSFVGTTEVQFIQGMSGLLKGTSMFVSQGPQVGIVMKFQDINYPGEYFAYDGQEVTVGHMSPGQKSPIAEFLYRYNRLMKEGFIGGSLSTAWPLLTIDEQKVEMKSRKTKVEGKELYELEYRPKESLGDLRIKIYFDPETYRHVRTEYRIRVRDDMSFGGSSTYDPLADESVVKSAGGGGMAIGESRPDSIYLLVEKFDNFKKVGNTVLPHKYVLDYSLEGSGHAFIANWTLNASTWVVNQKYDSKIFQAQK